MSNERFFPRLFSFRSDIRGVALIEFALVLPFMLLLLFGAVEIGRYIVITEKVDKAAYALTNIVAQYSPATSANKCPNEICADKALIVSVFPQFDRMMVPYNDLANEFVIFSSLVHQNNSNLIRWQISGGGSLGGQTSAVSGTVPPAGGTTRTGGTCAVATFPGDPDAGTFLANAFPKENIIVGEVFFSYHSILSSVIGPLGFQVTDRVISRRFYMYPRNGDLLDLPPNAPITAGNCP